MNSMRTMEIQTSLMKTKNDGKPVVMNKESHQLERNILNLAINAFGRMQDIAQGSIDESSGDIFLRVYNEANAQGKSMNAQFLFAARIPATITCSR